MRQQLSRREGRANVALSDFVAPSGADHVGAFVVTAGIGEDKVADRFKNANDDYSAIMVKAWPTDWRKHMRSGCTRACGRNSGAMPPEET